ncbi:hypothetical protein A3Q56_00985 [Intoshia linei]|uniref:Protein kinase domain-containing protein n=1 Tax=Intoshia linei TaxID=1819745 RepID=A0A177BAA1_9BILA|nr:hypothetical protein A3Q56_00985 [Intoshia linei]
MYFYHINNNGTKGFKLGDLREIDILLKLKHKNIVTLKEIATGKTLNRIFLIMEFYEYDLGKIIDSYKKPFNIPQIKCLLYQILEGVCHLHENFIIHRDLKVANIMLDNYGILKIGDFGLSRYFTKPCGEMTPNVVTLWYRAPELLFGSKDVSSGIDIWAISCIFGELVENKPIFPGKSEIAQILHISELLGAPNEHIWPELKYLKAYSLFNFKNKYNKLKSKFPHLSKHGLDLMNDMFMYNPAYRTGNCKYGESTPGVNITVCNDGFGKMGAIVDISALKIGPTEIFNTFFNFLKSKKYQDGVDMAAAPYDFKNIFNDLYYDKVGKLIEKMYNVNKTRKDYYIKLYIPIIGPFSGLIKTIQDLIVGDNFDIFWTNSKDWIKLMSSWNTAVSLFPSHGKWTSDEPLVLTKKGNYTIKNINKLYKTLNPDNPLLLCRWLEVRPFIADTKDPKVDSMCFFGGDIDTIKQLDYRNTHYPHGNPKQYYEKADSTVNHEFLARCTTWSNLTYFRYHRQYSHTTNVNILHNLHMIKTIYDYINRNITRPQRSILKSVQNSTFYSIF